MKPYWLLIPVALLLCGCKGKTPTDSKADPGPTTTSRAAPTLTPATPEQLSGVVCLRVAFGGMPPRETVGAIIHPDEIANKALVKGNDRFVVALLRGWKEEQLNDPHVQFIVYRQAVNSAGEKTPVASRSRLLQYDPQTGLVVVSYQDRSGQSSDAGFHLDRQDFAHSDLPLLRISLAPESATDAQAAPAAAANAAPNSPARAPQGRPLLVDVGQYLGEKKPAPAVQFSSTAPDSGADKTYLAMSSPSSFSGFVEESAAGAPVVTPATKISLDIKIPTLTAKSISFEGAGGFIKIKAQFAASPEGFSPMMVRILFADSPPANLVDAAQSGANGVFAPLERRQERFMNRAGATGEWQAMLPMGALGQEKAYLAQFAWPLSSRAGSASGSCSYGQPFLIRLQATAAGIVPSVEGLADISPEPQAPIANQGMGGPLNAMRPGVPPGRQFGGRPSGYGNLAPAAALPDAPVTSESEPVASFPLEAAVRNSHLMAGGREILFELEGAPYWKRFSFEKKTWLPLPPGDLSNAALTGNLSSLFVLDRNSGELKKYLLSSLQSTGSVKLPRVAEFVAILAGCNSDHSPVHVLTANEALALAPETLQRRDMAPFKGQTAVASWRNFSRSKRYSITGDGLGIFALSDSTIVAFYNSDAQGLERSYIDATNPIINEELGVTGGYRRSSFRFECWESPSGMMQDASKLPAIVVHPAFIRLAENAPILFRFADKAPNGAPATSPRITCSSCFSLAPFANVETPELAGFSASGGAQTKDVFNWAAFDPYSFRLGTLAQDHKTWSVHTLVRPQTLDQPVLLNWPDTSIPRGGELQFKPLLLGATEFSAELYARPGRAAVDAGRGIVQTKFGNQELDSLELLNLKVPAKDGAALSYPISLHIVGTQLPFAARPNADFKILNSIGNSFKLLDTPTSDFLPLSAVTLSFKDQVLDIQGPVSGCAAIISAANRIDFLSLQTRKIVGSTVTPAGAFYYPGSGALIEYDPGKRTLTRISVPDGRRERSISMPPNVNIAAIGVGMDPGSPITVAVTITQNESVTHFSDLTFTSTEYRNLITVLDGNTLQAAGWSQPVSLARVFNKTAQEVSYGAIPPPQGKPPALPASHSGCIVTLPGSLLVISPTYSIYYPFGNSDTNNLVFGGNLSPGGSISGLMATSGGGDVFKGGSKVPNAPGGESLGLTPCGRYKLVRFFELNQNSMLTVQLAENATPLLIGARFAFFKDDPFMIMPRPILRRVAMLSDEGPLAILSQSGREMQIVDFNIPAMMKVLEPEEFHVVSQPVPCVIEGGTLQYQVKVNNAAAVKNVRLQSPVPGATISSQGLLSFTAPGHITEPTKIHIAIEVEGKNGNAVLHEFPIFVLPRPRTTAKPQVGPI